MTLEQAVFPALPSHHPVGWAPEQPCLGHALRVRGRRVASCWPSSTPGVLGGAHVCPCTAARACAVPARMHGRRGESRERAPPSRSCGAHCSVHGCAQASWRFTHNRDIVPSWPPTWVGFHHVAREVWQVDFDGAGVRAHAKCSLCYSPAAMPHALPPGCGAQAACDCTAAVMQSLALSWGCAARMTSMLVGF